MYYYKKNRDESKYQLNKETKEELNPTSVKCQDFYSSNPKNEKLKQRETFC